MTRTRVASVAGVLLLAWAALSVPAAIAQTPSPSPSGSGAAPSPATTPAASPSPSASPAQTRALSLLLSAEPSTVEAGEKTVLVAQVANTGTAALDASSVTVTLPTELELVSSFPDGAAAGDGYRIDLGPLAPGESAVAQLTVRGVTVTPAAVVTAAAASGETTATDSTEVTVVEGGGAGELAVTSQTRNVLSQVGAMVHYEVVVSNEGDEDLDDVIVVDVVPREVGVFSVDIVDEVEAVQIGESQGRQDIVWNVGSLPAGASITLPWDGHAISAGDLRAVNSVRGLVGSNETARSSSESFLASEGPRDVENPHFEPIEKRVVRFVDPPPADPSARAATQPGVVLPLTGVSVSTLVLGGLLLVFAGILLVLGARLAPRASRKAIAATVLAGLIGAACVSGGGGEDVEGSARQATPRTFGTDDPRDDDTRVKGERIVRGEDDEVVDATVAPASPPPAASASPVPPTPPTATPAPPVAPATATPPPAVAAPATAPAPAPVDPEPIRVVTVVKTGLEDLPVETQASRDGDNTVSFGWDEAAGGITAATSGRRFDRTATSELMTNLSQEDGAILNRITLRNTAEAARLRVHGRLVHEVWDGATLIARLRSEPVDVVLSPGGEVAARFSYLVPTGDYTVRAAFESAE